MILKVYSIKDQKAEVFNSPFFQTSHGESERNFHKLVNDSKSTVSQYPKDFDLYYLGEFDDNTGKFKALDAPQHMISAIQLKSEPAQLMST